MTLIEYQVPKRDVFLIGDATINDEGSYACFVFSSMKVHPSSMLSRAASLAILEPQFSLGVSKIFRLILARLKMLNLIAICQVRLPLNLLGGLMEWI